MELEVSEDYEELAVDWQYQLMLTLKEALSSEGIAAAAKVVTQPGR